MHIVFVYLANEIGRGMRDASEIEKGESQARVGNNLIIRISYIWNYMTKFKITNCYKHTYELYYTKFKNYRFIQTLNRYIQK